jgi:hypothetical protein
MERGFPANPQAGIAEAVVNAINLVLLFRLVAVVAVRALGNIALVKERLLRLSLTIVADPVVAGIVELNILARTIKPALTASGGITAA